MKLLHICRSLHCFEANFLLISENSLSCSFMTFLTGFSRVKTGLVYYHFLSLNSPFYVLVKASDFRNRRKKKKRKKEGNSGFIQASFHFYIFGFHKKLKQCLLLKFNFFQVHKHPNVNPKESILKEKILKRYQKSQMPRNCCKDYSYFNFFFLNHFFFFLKQFFGTLSSAYMQRVEQSLQEMKTPLA